MGPRYGPFPYSLPGSAGLKEEVMFQQVNQTAETDSVMFSVSPGVPDAVLQITTLSFSVPGKEKHDFVSGGTPSKGSPLSSAIEIILTLFYL